MSKIKLSAIPVAVAKRTRVMVKPHLEAMDVGDYLTLECSYAGAQGAAKRLQEDTGAQFQVYQPGDAPVNSDGDKLTEDVLEGFVGIARLS